MNAEVFRRIRIGHYAHQFFPAIGQQVVLELAHDFSVIEIPIRGCRCHVMQWKRMEGGGGLCVLLRDGGVHCEGFEGESVMMGFLVRTESFLRNATVYALSNSFLNVPLNTRNTTLSSRNSLFLRVLTLPLHSFLRFHRVLIPISFFFFSSSSRSAKRTSVTR